MLKETGKKRPWVWISTLFLCLVFVGVSALGLGGFFRQEFSGVLAAEPAMRMQAPVSGIPVTADGKALRSNGDNMEALYDGDETTSAGGEEPVWVTLDLGMLHRLAGVRFLPGGTDAGSLNRCLGTRFLAGKRDGTFYPVAVIEPENNGDAKAEWREILFDSAGEYRYLRVEIPAGGSFSEIQWLEYPAWKYLPSAERGKQDVFMDFYIHEVQEDTDAVVLTAVYDRSGVMTHLVRTEEHLVKEQESTLQVTIPGVPAGTAERYRVMAWEKDGTPAIPSPLQYWDNDCAPNLTLSNLFSDDMLFQAEKPLTIWGKAPAGRQVSVVLEAESGERVSRQTTVKHDFTWEVNLGMFPAGGKYRLEIVCGRDTKVYQNITFGDVWLCVGQSNMDYYMLGGKDTEEYLASETGKKEADNPNIRLLNLWNKGIGGAGAPVENLPLADGEKAWTVMTPDAANYCSAVGYFFAQELEQEYRIPIGLLSAAVGDTEINRWIPYGDQYGSFTSTDGGLFHNRVAPFQKLQIRGILMYQGEADQYRTDLTTAEYRDAMAGLVDDYRSIWGKDLPFYWAQLTRYHKDESAIREGQRLALEKIQIRENAGIISLIDLYGEYEAGQGNCREDIHPHQKREVAERFLRFAKRDVYGEEIPVSGPVYQGARVVGSKMELTFKTTGELALLPPERYADRLGQEKIRKTGANVSAPGAFEIAGKDGVYHPAKAVLRGDKVILESPKVTVPVSARYAWGAYPEMPNLTDETGLPCLTFSTRMFR